MPTVHCGFENRPRQLYGQGLMLYVELTYDGRTGEVSLSND